MKAFFGTLFDQRYLRVLVGHDPVLIGRFVAVGLGNTALSYGVYSLLIYVGTAYPIASFLALVSGIASGFVFAGRVVFRSRISGRFHKYLLVWAMLYCTHVGLIFVLIQLGLDSYSAGFLSLIPTAGLSFVLQRRFVFAD